MKKVVFTIVLLISTVLTPNLLRAQQNRSDDAPKKTFPISGKLNLSLQAGYAYSNLKVNLSDFVDTDYVPKSGFGIQASGEHLFYEGFFISVGAGFTQKNYRYQRTGPLRDQYANHKNGFLNFPLQLGLYIFNKPSVSKGVWAKISAGAYGDYWVSKSSEGVYYSFNNLQLDGTFGTIAASEKYNLKNNPYEYNRFQYGIVSQGQIGYNIDSQYSVFGSFMYQYGLKDINGQNEDKNRAMKINSYLISAGLMYKF